MALSIAHRLQTLALINIDNISKSSSGIMIKIPDLIKTSRPRPFQLDLYLPFFEKRLEWMCFSGPYSQTNLVLVYVAYI